MAGKGLWEQALEVAPSANIELTPMAIRLTCAVLAGVAVAVIYRLTRRSGSNREMVSTLILLTALMALVTLAVGDNAARAFSLVGALSVVRFRTAVADTRDTAFVVFAVAMGMVVGTGVWEGAVVGLPVIGVTAWLISVWEWTAPPPLAGESSLQLRLGLGHPPATVLAEVLGKQLDSARMTAASTAKQGAALDLSYTIRWRGDADVVGLVNALNRHEGVQSVEVKPV